MATMEVRSFDKPDEVRHFQGKGHGDILVLDDRTVGRGVFEPGWRWSDNVKPIAGTDSCQVSHFGYCLEGHMRVHMDDGEDLDVGPGDVVSIPPGHDAEVLGDATCVLVEFGEAHKYAKPD